MIRFHEKPSLRWETTTATGSTNSRRVFYDVRRNITASWRGNGASSIKRITKTQARAPNLMTEVPLTGTGEAPVDWREGPSCPQSSLEIWPESGVGRPAAILGVNKHSEG